MFASSIFCPVFVQCKFVLMAFDFNTSLSVISCLKRELIHDDSIVSHSSGFEWGMHDDQQPTETCLSTGPTSDPCYRYLEVYPIVVVVLSRDSLYLQGGGRGSPEIGLIVVDEGPYGICRP